MPVLIDFYLAQLEDGIVTVVMSPPVAIGSQTIRWQLQNRFGGSGFVQKWWSSGTPPGASGITITNSGQGQFNVQINSVDTSGLDAKNYSHVGEFMNTPRTCVTEGFLLLTPGGGP